MIILNLRSTLGSARDRSWGVRGASAPASLYFLYIRNGGGGGDGRDGGGDAGGDDA